ncbi:MAG: ABC transporter ATP-binding protein [Pseudomonadota bacterium]
MSIAHLLEDFTMQADGGQLHLLDEEALEEQRLTAFEQGYSAGWEDAAKAQDENMAQSSAGLSKSLQDMSFTYHEALNRMSLSLEPMFQSLTQLVLPSMLDQGFALRLSEQLRDMARDQIDQPMQVLVAEGCGAGIEAMISQDLHPSPRVIEDPALQPGQARLQVGISRREVDCGEVLTSVSRAFDSYIFEAKEALSNE